MSSRAAFAGILSSKGGSPFCLNSRENLCPFLRPEFAAASSRFARIRQLPKTSYLSNMGEKLALLCPRCAVPMGTMADGGGEGLPGIAYCSQCRSTWCAKGELAELLGVTDENSVLVAAWRHEVVLIDEVGPPCPVCFTETLREVPLQADLSVKMLGCDRCHGTLVEAGALPRIKSLVLRDVRSSRPPALGRSSRPPRG
jgi:Zn-finger nucleic acid-binding protein